MQQKGLVPILIVLLIAAAIGGYLVYSGKVNLPQKQIAQTLKSDASAAPTSAGETANWKTYTNERYSLKYPKELILEEEKLPNSSDVREITLTFPGTDSHGSSDRIIMSQRDNIYNRSDLDTYLKMDSGYTQESLNKTQASTINGAKARRHLLNEFMEDVIIEIQSDQNIYYVHYFPDSTIDKHKANIKTLDSIVSTLVFTPSMSGTKNVKIIDGDIYVIKDGKEIKITSWGYNYDPVLSPDNTKIAYLSKTKESIQNEKTKQGYIGRSDNVWIVDVNGNNPVQITRHLDYIYRGDLHWIDNKRLLFTDGTQSAKVYSINTKAIQIVLGSETPVAACLDACGFGIAFFYNKDYSYLVRIKSQENTSIIGVLNTKTLKGIELSEQQFSVYLETVSFSADNKTLFFKASTSSNQQKQVSIDLTSQQVNLN